MSTRYGKAPPVVAITGGGSGIGRASCLAFARTGSRIVIVGRTAAKVDAVAAEVRALGTEALAVKADVTRSSDVRAMIGAAVERFGALDVVLNSAGVSPSGHVTEMDETAWDECLAVNLRAVFLTAKYAIPELRRRGGGVILNVAGTFGLNGAAGKAAYAAAKAGVINLTRVIALDHAREQIRCNCICPGFVDTPLNSTFVGEERNEFLRKSQPLAGTIHADEVAAMAVYLASDAAKMVTGQTFVIDGGQQAGLTP